MEVTVLGSGTGMPLWDRAAPSLAIFLDRKPVLFDMGPGTLRQMTRAGLDFETLEHIFLTHFHPDHTVDLVPLLFATRNPNVLTRKKPLVIHGPSGLKPFLQGLRDAFTPWLDLPGEIVSTDELGVAPYTERRIGAYRILAHPTGHTAFSVAYRIEGPDGRVCVYSGDADYSETLASFGSGADLIILECSFPEKRKVPGHLTPSLAGLIAQRAGAKKLLLVHFYPECLVTDIATPCRSTFGGEIILGSDLLRVHI